MGYIAYMSSIILDNRQKSQKVYVLIWITTIFYYTEQTNSASKTKFKQNLLVLLDFPE